MKDQIDLTELIFSLSWEDPSSDVKAINITTGKKVFAITSGGCNVLCFLRYDPAVIYAVDINPVQSYVLELKVAAMKKLNYEEFIAFMGLTKSDKRRETFANLCSDLTDGAKEFWKTNIDLVEQGFLGKGKFEKYTQRSAKMMRILQGKKLIKGLFEKKSTEEQARFFDDQWDTWRLRTIFKILYNKRKLAKRGLKDDYFHFDDGSKSFAENFYNRHKNVIRNVSIEGNYFLSLYVLGRYRNESERPDYLRKEYYEEIKSRLDRIINIAEDAKLWLNNHKGSDIDCFAMSNICELMSDHDTRATFESIYHAGKNGAEVCFRNLMVPRDVPVDMVDKITIDKEMSKELVGNDRSFVYSKVNKYVINKD